MKARAWGLVLLSGWACGPAPRPPDVVLVLVDTLRADRTSVLDPDLPTTPRLAQLAARGTTYTQAVASSSWTLPSMAALFSGRDVATSRHGAFVDAPALAERFAAAGYDTIGLVANPLVNVENGFARGFHLFEVASPEDTASLQADIHDLRAWDAAALVERASRALLDAPRDRPVFLYLHLMDTHVPYDTAHAERVPPLPGWTRGTTESEPPPVRWAASLTPREVQLLCGWRLAYDGQVHFVDEALGRLAARLEEDLRGRAWLMAITADHGEGLYEHAREADSEVLDLPLGLAYGDHGEQLYEEALRVPLWLLGAEELTALPRGRVEERLVRQQDLGGTLLLLAGLRDERPRLPLDAEDPSAELVLGTGTRGWFARSATRKLVEPFAPRLVRLGIGPRLFAVEGARYLDETEDLAGEEPAEVERLRAILERWRALHAADEDTAPDPETEARLRALGYVR